MRVLYIFQYFTTPSGSTGTRAYELAKRLVESGHEVHMVCSSAQRGSTGLTGEFNNGLRTGVFEGIHIYEFDLKYSNYDSLTTRAYKFFKYSFKSISLVIKLKYDIIFATSTPLTAGIPGIFGKIFCRKPFVFEVRDLWPELPKAMKIVTNPIVLMGMSVLEFLAYNTADACVGLAPGIVAGIKKRLRRKDKEVAFIPNACDLELFSDKSIVYSHEEILPNDFVSVFTGAHGVANGLDAVLDAAKILCEKGISDIKILFVGDGKKKPHLIERKQRENLTNCIFADPIPKNQMNTLLNRADIGLMILDNVPAFYNGTSPNKFFDYLAAGLPILNNYPGWISEYIKEYECGYTVQPGDPKVFADCLIQARNDKREGKIDNYGKNAKSLAEEKFDRNKLAQDFIDLLEKYSKKK